MSTSALQPDMGAAVNKVLIRGTGPLTLAAMAGEPLAMPQLNPGVTAILGDGERGWGPPAMRQRQTPVPSRWWIRRP